MTFLSTVKNIPDRLLSSRAYFRLILDMTNIIRSSVELKSFDKTTKINSLINVH